MNITNDLRGHGPSVNSDVIDIAEQKRRNAMRVLGILLRAYVPKNTSDWRELEAALAFIDQQASAAPAAPSLAPGWVAVPATPTAKMSAAFMHADRYSFATFSDRYRAMLAASPTPTEQDKP